MAPAIEESTVEVRQSAVVRRWPMWAGVGVLALLALGGILLAIFWPFSSQKVTESIQDDWPGKITAARFHSTYFPHPGCVIENVVMTHGADASVPPLVTIAKVTIVANYHDLFLRPGYISEITLEGLKISVPAKQDLNASAAKKSTSTKRVGEIFTKDAVVEVARGENSPLKFAIHQLSLKSVSSSTAMAYDLHMGNAEPPGEIVARGKFGPFDPEHLEEIPLSGNYTFDQADLGVFHGLAGTLAAKGEFSGVLGKIETEGTIDVPNFEVVRSEHRVPIKAKFDATVNGVGGDTVLRAVDATIAHTNAHFDGTIAGKAGQPGKTATMNVNVVNGRIEDILRVFVNERKSALDGPTSFHARVAWPSEGDDFVKKVALTGEFAIDHAHSEHNRLQDDLITLSKRASGKKDEKTPVDENVTMDAKGKVSLAKGVANLSDLFFTVPGAEANMHGTYNLETAKVDLRGDLKTQASLSNEATGAQAVLLKPLDPLFKRKHAGAVIPVQMTGTFHDAHLGLAVLPKM